MVKGGLCCAAPRSPYTSDFESDLRSGLAKALVKTYECSVRRAPLAPNKGCGKLKRVGGTNFVSGQQFFRLFTDRLDGQNL